MWEPDQMTFCDHPVSYGPRVSFGFNIAMIFVVLLRVVKSMELKQVGYNIEFSFSLALGG